MRNTTLFHTYNQFSCMPRESGDVPSFDIYPVDSALLKSLMSSLVRGNCVF